MSDESKSTQIVNGILVACAFFVVVTLAKREYFASPRASAGRVESRQVANWTELGSVGHRVGPLDAKVVVVEFADFECPACASLEQGTIRSLTSKYSQNVAFVFRHWPLRYHRFAYPAARAAECAAEQGMFQQLRHELYSQQDSLGLKSWRQYAEAAGVPDLPAFEKCTGRSVPVPAIEVDSKVAVALKSGGTPTILVNGTMIGGAPDSTTLDNLIAEALKKANVGQ